MIMSLKQRKIKYEPRIKLNHNIYINVLHKVNNSCYFTQIFRRKERGWKNKEHSFRNSRVNLNQHVHSKLERERSV